MKTLTLTIALMTLLMTTLTTFASTSACGLEKKALKVKINRTVKLYQSGSLFIQSMYYNNGFETSSVSSSQTYCKVRIYANEDVIKNGAIFSLDSGYTFPDSSCFTRLDFYLKNQGSIVIQCQVGAFSVKDLTLESIKYNLGSDITIL